KNIGEWVKGKEDVKRIFDASRNSNGAAVDDSDLGEIKLLALNALNLKEERAFLGKYLEKGMAKMLPNFTELAGHIIGARLLAKAGSAKKLAFMPGSTIQVLGAEKALFQHLKKGSKGPKYGFLYAHPMVRGVKPWFGGKVARSLAAKLSIAVKEDYFGKKNIAESLKKDLEKRIKEIEKSAPKKPERGGAKTGKSFNTGRPFNKRNPKKR
ncbi:MAG: C/D box methylation guide ribonucleoprotein complex aNOP56 subunit, partial [Candidatus Diapherotrites archaeon]